MKTKPVESHVELCSEKVRSIIEQPPPSLLRYGTLVITAALIILAYVSSYIPYNQVYTGTAVIREIPDSSKHFFATLLIKFPDRRPVLSPTEKLRITLQTPKGKVEGELIKLSSWRDSLSRQETVCSFPLDKISPLKGYEVDFTLVRTSGSILQAMLGKVF